MGHGFLRNPPNLNDTGTHRDATAFGLPPASCALRQESPGNVEMGPHPSPFSFDVHLGGGPST